MRAPYVPAPLPDETLHSLVARYARHTRHADWADVGLTAFGDPWTIATLELPHALDPLCSWLGPPWTPALVAGRLTPLPYYAAFHDPAGRDAVVEAMRGPGGPVRSRLGAASWWMGPGGPVRYCPTCRDGMLDAHGELWWRRSHQLPGVLVCPEHGDALVDAVLPPAGRHAFVAATAATCPAPAAGPRRREGHPAAGLLKVARSSASLLGGSTWDGRPSAYGARLAAAGLRWSRERVDLGRVTEAVVDHHRDVLPALGRSVGHDLSDGRWAVPMLTGRRRVHHPLLHVLLDGFLRAGRAATSSFGRGPWRCEDPLGDHRGEATVAAVVLGQEDGRVVGRFACPCGHAYARVVGADGKIGRPRTVCHGPGLEAALRRLVAESGSPRAVAGEVGLDVPAMLREATNLGIVLPWTGRGLTRVVGPVRMLEDRGEGVRTDVASQTRAPDRRPETTASSGRRR